MVYVDVIARYLLLDFGQPEIQVNLLLACQLLLTATYTIRLKGDFLVGLTSKLTLTVLQRGLITPSIIIGADGASGGWAPVQGSLLLVVSVINSFVHENMQLACSF